MFLTVQNQIEQPIWNDLSTSLPLRVRMVQHDECNLEEHNCKSHHFDVEAVCTAAFRFLSTSSGKKFIEKYEKQNATQTFLIQGIYKMTNLTIDDGTWPQAIPTGFYQIKAVFGKFYSIQIDVEIVSDIKESMG